MKTIFIKNKTYSIPTQTHEVSVKKYFDYMQIGESYQDWLSAVKEGEIEEEEWKELSFIVDMLVAITDIPTHLLYEELPYSTILELHSWILCEQAQETLPLFKNTFEFIDCTPAEIETLQTQINACRWYQIFKKLRLEYRLWQMKKPVLFVVAPEMKEQSLSQWIVTEQFRKNIALASQELKSGIYSNIVKIIAHITHKAGEEYNEKTAQRREKVFENLPLCLANQIANFFLRMSQELQKNMQMSWKEQNPMDTQTNQPLPQKN